MKIPKAIEVLTLMSKAPDWVFDADNRNAIKQGIACMDYVEKIKRFPHEVDNIPLPGEDEE